MKSPQSRQSETASTLLEYLLAVSLIGLVMVGVLRGFTHDAKLVADEFRTEMGAGQIQCNDPMDPSCLPP